MSNTTDKMFDRYVYKLYRDMGVEVKEIEDE